jgi:DNA-binding transcriptional ArsR family regulator
MLMEKSTLRLQAKTIKALAHPSRLAIMAMLRVGERCVCELGPALGLRQANVSQHLAILKEANLVTYRREGLRLLYRVTDERIFEALDILTSVSHDRLEETRQALVSLEKGIEQVEERA